MFVIKKFKLQNHLLEISSLLCKREYQSKSLTGCRILRITKDDGNGGHTVSRQVLIDIIMIPYITMTLAHISNRS